MPRIFNAIRQRLLKENRLTRYLLYAVGEILLVVIGILIALQINNWNNERGNRAREVKYLNGLKADLAMDLGKLAEFITDKERKTSSGSLLLKQAPPTSAAEIRYVDSLSWNVFVWKTFVPSTKTLNELIGSGNLSFITNDSIKTRVLDLAQRYEGLAVHTAHMRREYDMYLYDRAMLLVEQVPFLDWERTLATNKLALKVEDSEARLATLGQQWATLLQDMAYQNGLKLAILNNNAMLQDCMEMVREIEGTIALIDKEIHEAP
ncbi:MAG: hypothetical protein KIT10_04765 [Flavobacteriales bacterium]|nr:hypothetical protein [Flavobacteriales bacterium]